VFRKFLRLDVAFHDSYTSGRAVSRLTSDMDAIAELLSGGFDGLVNAVLSIVGVSSCCSCLTGGWACCASVRWSSSFCC